MRRIFAFQDFDTHAGLWRSHAISWFVACGALFFRFAVHECNWQKTPALHESGAGERFSWGSRGIPVGFGVL